MTELERGGIVKRPWLVLGGIVAIPALLSTLREPAQDGYRVSDRARARCDVTTIALALEEYAMEHDGEYPEGLADLVTPDDRGHRCLNQTRLPRDPWGREYVYVSGNSPNVLTYGRDGVLGGTGEDADVDYEALVGAQESDTAPR